MPLSLCAKAFKVAATEFWKTRSLMSGNLQHGTCQKRQDLALVYVPKIANAKTVRNNKYGVHNVVVGDSWMLTPLTREPHSKL